MVYDGTPHGTRGAANPRPVAFSGPTPERLSVRCERCGEQVWTGERYDGKPSMVLDWRQQRHWVRNLDGRIAEMPVWEEHRCKAK